MIEKGKMVQVGVAMSAGIPVPPAEAANYFHLTVVGPEVQLLVGSVNLIEFHEAATSDSVKMVIPEISHRFLLSTLGFAQLKARVDEIAQKVPALPEGTHLGAMPK